MKSLDSMLSLLDLFDENHATCSLEEAQAYLSTVSSATVYRYLQSLTKAGLVADGPGRTFTLGPRILELDRVAQRSDRLLIAGQRFIPGFDGLPPGLSLLAVSYGRKVLCIHSQCFGESNVPTSYVRGRPMPLFRGATSKIILAYLPAYQLRAALQNYPEQIREARLGETWDELKDNLRKLRKDGYAVAHGEVDRGLTGVAVPLLQDGKPKKVLGSLSYVMLDTDFDGRDMPAVIGRLRAIGAQICHSISAP
jgi:DNA-binding IclR family transcriptional regulator